MALSLRLDLDEKFSGTRADKGVFVMRAMRVYEAKKKGVRRLLRWVKGEN
jgi:hypothetical protein